jgi:hypothetical protein
MDYLSKNGRDHQILVNLLMSDIIKMHAAVLELTHVEGRQLDRCNLFHKALTLTNKCIITYSVTE